MKIFATSILMKTYTFFYDWSSFLLPLILFISLPSNHRHHRHDYGCGQIGEQAVYGAVTLFLLLTLLIFLHSHYHCHHHQYHHFKMLMFGGKIGQNRSAGNAGCGGIVIAIDIVHIFALLQLSPPSTSSLSNAHPAHVLEGKIGAQAMHGAVRP